MSKPFHTQPAPSIDPPTLLALIRHCVPEADHVDESGLRTLMFEVDAHLAAYVRAVNHRQWSRDEDPGLEAAA